MTQQSMFAEPEHPRAHEGDFGTLRYASVGATYLVAFVVASGAPRRVWMHEPMEVRVTAPPVFGARGRFSIEVAFADVRRPRATLTMRPMHETPRFRQLVHLYARDNIGGHTTGHPFVLA